MNKAKNPHARALGRKGGKATSEAKRIAARINGCKPKLKRSVGGVAEQIPGADLPISSLGSAKIAGPESP